MDGVDVSAPPSPAPSLWRSIAGTYGTQLVVLPMSLVSSVLQTRVLGPEGRGQVSLVQTLVGVAVLYLGLGLPSALTFSIARGQLTPHALKKTLAAFWLAAMGVLGVVIGVIVLSGKREALLGSLSLAITAPTIAALFSLGLHNGWMAAILSGQRQFGFINRVSLFAVFGPTISYAVALMFVPLAFTPAFLAFGVLVGTELVRGLLLALRVWQSNPGSTAPPDSRLLGPLRPLVAYSLLAWACDSIQFLTYRVDVWLVRDARGDAELGHYSLAVTLGEMVWLLASAMATVLFPHVPTLDKAAAVRLTCRLAGFALVASCGFAVAGYLLSIPLLPVLFTPAFEPSTRLLGLLLVGIAPYSVAKIVGNYLAGAGAMRFSLYTALLGMVVCVGLDLILIPRLGAVGAAIATSTAYLVFTLVIVAFFQRQSRVPWADLLRYAVTRLPKSSGP
jgi:O-antigen/teichoic acid export membrane protein